MKAFVDQTRAGGAELAKSLELELQAGLFQVSKSLAVAATLAGDVARQPAVVAGLLVVIEIVAVILDVAVEAVGECVALHRCVALSRLREFALQDAMADTAVMGIC